VHLLAGNGLCPVYLEMIDPSSDVVAGFVACDGGMEPLSPRTLKYRQVRRTAAGMAIIERT
jgi:hypothetical protein